MTLTLISACHFLSVLYTKLFQLSCQDLGLFWAESCTEGCGVPSASAFLLGREVPLLLVLPFFQRTETVIESKLQQLVNTLGPAPVFYPAPIFRLQLLQINARPQMVAV